MRRHELIEKRNAFENIEEEWTDGVDVAYIESKGGKIFKVTVETRTGNNTSTHSSYPDAEKYLKSKGFKRS